MSSIRQFEIEVAHKVNDFICFIADNYYYTKKPQKTYVDYVFNFFHNKMFHDAHDEAFLIHENFEHDLLGIPE